MICSDGLSPVVGTEAIRRVLSSVADPDEAVRQLADLTIEAGGPDNLTVIVIDVRKAIGDAAVVRPVVLGSAATKAVAS